MSEVKACPFCGATNDDFTVHGATCYIYLRFIAAYGDIEQIKAAWNRRAPEAGQNGKCKQCHGDGYVRLPHDPRHPVNQYVCEDCPICRGSGLADTQALAELTDEAFKADEQIMTKEWNEFGEGKTSHSHPKECEAIKAFFDGEMSRAALLKILDESQDQKNAEAQAEPVADEILEQMYEAYSSYLSPVDRGLSQHMVGMLKALNIYLAAHPAPREAVPDEAAIKRALDATVLEGETVYWHIVFGLNDDTEEMRATMAQEIIRAALLAAAPEQQG